MAALICDCVILPQELDGKIMIGFLVLMLCCFDVPLSSHCAGVPLFVPGDRRQDRFSGT